MSTPHLVWSDTSAFLYKYVHGGYSSYEVAFGTILYIIKSVHYTLFDPIYYYDSEENYPRNKNHLVYGSESSSTTLSQRVL